MFKKMVLIAVTLLLIVPTVASATPIPVWSNLGGPNLLANGQQADDYACNVALDGNGNIYVAGETYGNLDGNTNAGIQDVFLAKYDQDGNKLWSKEIGREIGSGSYDNTIFASLALDSNGNVYICGTLRSFHTNLSYSDLYVVEFDPSGNKIKSVQFGTLSSDWMGRYPHPFTHWTGPMAIDASGNIYMTGLVGNNFDGHPNLGGYDAFLVKMDSNLNKVWSVDFGSSGWDCGYAVRVDGNGNVLVEATINANTNWLGGNAMIYKFDSGGNQLSSNRISFDQLVSDADGNFYATATITSIENDGGQYAYLIKYNSNGNILWQRQFGSKFGDYPSSPVIGADGNIYLTGQIGHGWGFGMPFIACYNKDGVRQFYWHSKVKGWWYDGWGSNIVVDAYGRVYIGGGVDASSEMDYNYFVAKFDTATLSPVLASPQENATLSAVYSAADDLFTWQANSCTKFAIQFSGAPDFAKHLNFPSDGAGANPSFSVTQAQWDRITALSGTVFWRVCAKNKDNQSVTSGANMLVLDGETEVNPTPIPTQDVGELPDFLCSLSNSTSVSIQFSIEPYFLHPVNINLPTTGSNVGYSTGAKKWALLTKVGPGFYWRFKNKLTSGETAYSSNQYTAITGGPSITSPASGDSQRISSPLTINWNGTGFESFVVQACISPTFNEKVAKLGSSTGTSLTLSTATLNKLTNTLLYQGFEGPNTVWNMYVRIKGTTSDGYTAYSDPILVSLTN